MTDPFTLERFFEAQDPIYHAVIEELKIGQKRTHWMWFVFPQIKGLGMSAMAQKYAITSQEEAAAYSEHPILGIRLKECTKLVANIEGRSAREIFGSTDELKFRSCMTLFEYTAVDAGIFQAALLKYFDGKPDQLTLSILNKQ